MPLSINRLKSTAPQWVNYQPTEADARENPHGIAMAERARGMILDADSYIRQWHEARAKLAQMKADPTASAEEIKKVEEEVNYKLALAYHSKKRMLSAVDDADTSGIKPQVEAASESATASAPTSSTK